eukprot:7160272-Pyramimonas_sp.AAC.1
MTRTPRGRRPAIPSTPLRCSAAPARAATMALTSWRGAAADLRRAARWNLPIARAATRRPWP